jgi:hypothetical protein
MGKGQLHNQPKITPERAVSLLGELERLHLAEAREALRESNWTLYHDTIGIAKKIEARYLNMIRWVKRLRSV